MRLDNAWQYRGLLLKPKFIRSVFKARENIIAASFGQKPPHGPFMAEMDITYRCNCRCRMCQRWNLSKPNELSVAEYEELAREFADSGVFQISIAGGEPLVRTDVFKIISGFAKKGMSVNLCTNGMLLKDKIRQITDSGATMITVSIDGYSAAVNDKIRGIDGALKRVSDGVKAYMAIPLARRPWVRVRLTASNENVGEVRRFYNHWIERSDDVLLQPAHFCADASYIGENDQSFSLNPDAMAAQVAGLAVGKGRYVTQLLESLKQTGRMPFIPCFAGVVMARIDPWGDVYPCLEQHVRVGSVRRGRFSEIWRSDVFEAERHRIMERRDCACWYNNTALMGHWGGLLQRTSPKYLVGHLLKKRA